MDDDGDQLWEDISISYKMVIVINMGLKMGIGKIASQVIEFIINIACLSNHMKRTKTKHVYLYNQSVS